MTVYQMSMAILLSCLMCMGTVSVPGGSVIVYTFLAGDSGISIRGSEEFLLYPIGKYATVIEEGGSLLVLVANLLSKFRLIQNLIVQEQRSFKSQTLLSVIFGGVIVLSTYTGIDIGSYSLNTRVIGAMTAGLLGGPIVGLYASLIGTRTVSGKRETGQE